MTVTNSGLRKASRIKSAKSAGTYGTPTKGAKHMAGKGRRAFLKRDAAAEVKLTMFGEPGRGEILPPPDNPDARLVILDPRTGLTETVTGEFILTQSHKLTYFPSPVK